MIAHLVMVVHLVMVIPLIMEIVMENLLIEIDMGPRIHRTSQTKSTTKIKRTSWINGSKQLQCKHDKHKQLGSVIYPNESDFPKPTQCSTNDQSFV